LTEQLTALDTNNPDNANIITRVNAFLGASKPADPAPVAKTEPDQPVGTSEQVRTKGKEFVRTTPVKGTPEREAMDAKNKEVSAKADALWERDDKLKEEIEKAKYGSKRRESLEKQRAKVREQMDAFKDERDASRKSAHNAFLEDLIESGDEANRIAALDKLNGAKRENYERIKELAKEEAKAQGLEGEDADSAAMSAASSIMGYPGNRSLKDQTDIEARHLQRGKVTRETTATIQAMSDLKQFQRQEFYERIKDSYADPSAVKKVIADAAKLNDENSTGHMGSKRIAGIADAMEKVASKKGGATEEQISNAKSNVTMEEKNAALKKLKDEGRIKIVGEGKNARAMITKEAYKVDPNAGEALRLVNRESGSGDQTPPRPKSGDLLEDVNKNAAGEPNVKPDEGAIGPGEELGQGDFGARGTRQAMQAKYPRISVEPIASESASAPSEMIVNISDITGRNVRVGKTGAGGGKSAAGVYKPATADTVIRRPNDVDTAAHEIAHSLDDEYGIVAQWNKPRAKSPYDAELEQFWWHGSATPSGPRSKLAYKRAEGVAEFVRAYMVNPDAARTAAPTFAKFFESKVPAEVLAKIRAAGDDVRKWSGASPAAKTKANIQWEPEKPAGVVDAVVKAVRGTGADFEITALDKINQMLGDRLFPVIKAIREAKIFHGIKDLLPEHDPELLIRNHAGINDKIEDVLDRGMTDAHGKRVTQPFKEILEPLDKTNRNTLDRDTKDMLAFAVSERVLERGEVLDKRSFRELAAQLEKDIGRYELAASQSNVSPDMKAKIKAAADRLKTALKTAEQVQGPNALRLKAIIDALPNTRYAIDASKAIRANYEQKGRLSGAGALMERDDVIAQKTIAELSKDPARLARLKDSAARYREWADSLLKYMLEKGRLTPEQYQGIKEDNNFYVSFNRIMDEVAPSTVKRSNKHLGTVRKAIQKFTGSTRPMDNPLMSLLEKTYSTVREADRNEVLRSFIDVLTNDRGMYQGKPQPFAGIGRRVQPQEPNSIQVFRNGKAEHWQFPTEIHETLKGVGQDDFHILVKLASIPSQILKNAVTHSPMFMARNVLRDTVARSILSEHGGKPWDVLKGLTKDEISQIKQYGGGQAGLYLTDRKSYYREQNARMRELTRNDGIVSTIIASPKKLAQGYLKLAKDSELIGRAAEFRRAHKHARESLGYDDYNASLYAANKSRGLMDFAVAGSLVRTLNQLVPFTNAAVQGLRKSYQVGKKDPVGFARRMAVYTIPMSLAVWAWNARDDKTEAEYWQLPAYQRDMFWNFKFGNTWLRVPKPFELGMLSSGVERAIAKMRGDDHAFEGYGGSVGKALIPFDEGAVAGPLKPVMETMANHDFFRDRYIVPPYENDLELDRRMGTENASRLGQMLQKMTNVDARKADYLVQNQFGGFGQMATATSDIGKKDTSQQLMRLSGVTSPSPTSAARDVQAVMQIARERGETASPLVDHLRDLLKTAMDSKKPEDQQAAREFASKVRKVYDGTMTPKQAIEGIGDRNLAGRVDRYKPLTAEEYRFKRMGVDAAVREFRGMTPDEQAKVRKTLKYKILDDDKIKDPWPMIDALGL
jgi:hypothetical protein